MASRSNVFRQAVSHSAYSAVGTISVFLVNFLFAGLTIRFLGNDQAGFFIVLSSLFALSQVVGGFGLGTPATKRAAELYAAGDTATVRRLVGSVLLVNGLIGLVAVVGCIVFFPLVFEWSRLAPTLRADAFTATVLMAGSFFADQAAGSLRILYAACLRQDIRNYSMSAMGLLGGIVRIVWLACYPTMPAAAASTFAVSAAWLILDAWLVRKLLGRAIWPTWCMAEIRPLGRFSLWEIFNAVGICAGNTVDRFILTSFMGSGSLPHFAIAQRLFSQIHTALAQQFSFMFPLLAATGGEVRASIAAMQDRARWFLAALGAVVYADLLLAGPTIVAVLIGPEFAEKARWAVFLASIQGLVFSFIITNYFLHYAVGNGSINALFNVGNNILATILALWLIPRYDYIGASIGQLSVILTVGFYLHQSKRILGLQSTGIAYWGAYVSPLVLFGVTVAVGKSIEAWRGPSIASTVLAVLVGTAMGLASAYGLERSMFRSCQRVQMVQSAWNLILRRISARQNTPAL